MKQCTLVFLVRSNEVLLAIKKRGFGAGHWNGVGGKVEEGETIEAAAARETQEEIGVTPRGLKQMAVLKFYNPHVPAEKQWDQEVTVFVTDTWDGEPTESEEMKPQWFTKTALPFDEMWEDDRLWLRRVLEGEELVGSFTFGPNEEIAEHDIQSVVIKA